MELKSEGERMTTMITMSCTCCNSSSLTCKQYFKLWAMAFGSRSQFRVHLNLSGSPLLQNDGEGPIWPFKELISVHTYTCIYIHTYINTLPLVIEYALFSSPPHFCSNLAQHARTHTHKRMHAHTHTHPYSFSPKRSTHHLIGCTLKGHRTNGGHSNTCT